MYSWKRNLLENETAGKDPFPSKTASSGFFKQGKAVPQESVLPGCLSAGSEGSFMQG